MSDSELREPGTQAGTSMLSSVGTAASGDPVMSPKGPLGRLVILCVKAQDTTQA